MCYAQRSVNVNIGKLRYMYSQQKKWTKQPQINLEDKPLEVIQNYKYFWLDFNENLRWDTMHKKNNGRREEHIIPTTK